MVFLSNGFGGKGIVIKSNLIINGTHAGNRTQILLLEVKSTNPLYYTGFMHNTCYTHNTYRNKSLS